MVDFTKILAEKLAENAIKNRENKVTEKALQKAVEAMPIVRQVKDALNMGKSIKEGVDSAYNKLEKNNKKDSSKNRTPIQDAANARREAENINNVTPVNNRVITPLSKSTIDTSNKDIQSMIVRVAKEVGVDPAIALSIAQIESGFNPNAVGDNGNSFGLFQIHKPSHPDYEGGNDPEANTRYALRLFKGLLDRNGGSVNKAIWAYNAGQGNLNKGILPASTRAYIDKVANLAPQYRQSGISEVAPVSQQNREIIQSMASNNTQQGGRLDDNIQTQQTLNTPPTKPDAVLSTPTQDALLTQLQGQINDPRNEQVSIPTMYNRLMNQYNELYNTIQTQDPRYQGGIVEGQRYYVDPAQLQSRMELDRIARGVRDARGMVAPNSSKAQDYLNQAQAMYQVAKANEAGVPYEDYQTAMLNRQKQMIATKAAQMEMQMNMAIQNESNIFRKQQLIQQMEQNKIAAQNAINNIDYQLRYGSYDANNQAARQMQLQNIRALQEQNAADLQYNRELAKLTYQNQLNMERDAAKPQSQSGNWSGLNAINALSGYNPQVAGKLIQASGMGSQWFPQMTPELAQELWGQPTKGQQQGFFGRLMSGWKGNVGLQANEQ